MSESNPLPRIDAYIRIAIYFALILIAIVEASRVSFLFGHLVGTDYRLPRLFVVVGAGVLFALVFLTFDRIHPFSHIFSLGRGDLHSPASSNLEWSLAIVCLATTLVPIFWAFGPPLDTPVTDFFHEGEILAGLPVLKHSDTVPILIHGPGRTLLPAALALDFARSGYQIAFIRLVTSVGSMMTALMVAVSAYVVSTGLLNEVAPRSRRHMIAAATSLIAVSLAVTLGDPTNRHTLMFCVFALAAGLTVTSDQERSRAISFSASLGVVCALAPIYVYRTGIEALLVAILVFVIVFSDQGKRTVVLVWAAFVGATASILGVVLFGGGNLYLISLRDILWWASGAGDLWNIPLTGVLAVEMVTLITASIGLTGYLAWRQRRSDEPDDRRRASIWTLLAGSGLISSLDTVGRSDVAHAMFTMLTVAIVVGSLAAIPILKVSRRHRNLVAAGIAALVLIVGWKGMGRFQNPGSIVRGVHVEDSILLPETVKEFARTVGPLLDDDGCLLVMTNEGVLNYAVDRPPCGPVLYPIYAAVPAGDQEMADWLRENPQKLAVLETDFWSDEIDGIPMKARLPQTWALIEEILPIKERIAGRTVAMRRDR